MSDAFAKITGFMLAAVLLFIVPIVFYANRQQNLVHLYIINKSTQLVESVKNTGVLTEDMYYSFVDGIYGLGGRYSIELARSHSEYNLDENGDYVKSEEVYYMSQLEEEIEKDGQIMFEEGDYVYIEIERVNKSTLEKIGALFLGEGIPQKEMVSFYGGYVKREGY